MFAISFSTAESSLQDQKPKTIRDKKRNFFIYKKKEIIVTNTPDVRTDATAENLIKYISGKKPLTPVN